MRPCAPPPRGTISCSSVTRRSRRLGAVLVRRFEGEAPHVEPDGLALAAVIGTRAVRVLRPGPAELKRALNRRVAVVFPRFSDLAPRITIEGELCDEHAYLAH